MSSAMGDTSENIRDVILPVNILLPFCFELDIDVFFIILKNVVARTRMDDPNFESIRAGMTDPIHVELEDISVNWKELKTKSQQSRQLKLIGFWAVHNYPTLGKKLLGETWSPPQRSSIEIPGGSVMTANQIDAVIFEKLKLRIIELRVEKSTLIRLKHFVTAPESVGKYEKGIVKSAKMTSFEIKDDHLKNCWSALKHGIFSMSEVRLWP